NHRPAFFRSAGGLCHGPDWPVGLRQIDSAQFHRGAGAARPRRIAVHRPRPTPVTSSHRLRVPEPSVAPVENHWRERQPRLERRRPPPGTAGSTGSPLFGTRRARRIHEPIPALPVWGPAAASRVGARPGDRVRFGVDGWTLRPRPRAHRAATPPYDPPLM